MRVRSGRWCGIHNWGTLTVDDTTVSDNESSGALPSDADGAGIYTQQGALTMNNSVVTGNQAIAIAPDGRYAEGAGILVDFGFSPPGATATLSVQNSVVSDNSSNLTNNTISQSASVSLGIQANGGGIHVGNGIPTSIVNTEITGNSASAIDTEGEPIGIDAGVEVNYSPLFLRNGAVRRQHLLDHLLDVGRCRASGKRDRARRWRHDYQHDH